MVTREVFWAIPVKLQYYFYAAAGISILVFALGVWSRVAVWTTGRDDAKFAGYTPLDFIIFALKNFFSRNCILAKKSFQLASYRGIMLLFIIYGFSTLFLGTILLAIHHYFFTFIVGRAYFVFSFLLDVGGLLLLIGLLTAITRRHLVAEVRRVTSLEDFFFLYIFLLIALSGFMVEGTRLMVLRPPNADYSYGGALFTELVDLTGVNPVASYTTIWIIHVLLVLFLIAYLPFSKFFHVFAAQVSIAAAEKRYRGAIGGRGY